MCLFISEGYAIVLEQKGHPNLLGPSFMGALLVLVLLPSSEEFDSSSISDSELKSSPGSIIAVSAIFLLATFLASLWAFVLECTFSSLKLLTFETKIGGPIDLLT